MTGRLPSRCDANSRSKRVSKTLPLVNKVQLIPPSSRISLIRDGVASWRVIVASAAVAMAHRTLSQVIPGTCLRAGTVYLYLG